MGSALMRELHARLPPGRQYVVFVAEANTDAQAFYRRHGLVVERKVEGGSHLAIGIEVDLPPPAPAVVMNQRCEQAKNAPTSSDERHPRSWEQLHSRASTATRWPSSRRLSLRKPVFPKTRGDDPELASYLRIEAQELEAGGLNRREGWSEDQPSLRPDLRAAVRGADRQCRAALIRRIP